MIRHREYYNNLRQLHNYTIKALFILEWPSAWSTSQIRPAWPRFRDELNLLLASFHKCLSCLFWRNQYLAVCFTDSHFTLNPPFPARRLTTSIQANNTAMPHRMYTDTHLYITFILLSILFFTLLPFSWASRLAQTLPVWHTYFLLLFPCTDFLCKIPLQIYMFCSSESNYQKNV